MPISPLALQRRHAELGRIRIGQKVATARGGTRPDKLDRFRFTSPHERHVRDLAQLYGGEPKAWTNGGRSEFEVITQAKSIPVIVVRGGISQWMETWSGGGCTHRCDGFHNALTDTDCDPEDPLHLQAKPTTRLSVMLTELDAIGVWRLESHGWNSAAELPGVVEMAQMVADLVPANLVLSERVTIADGKTSRFVVPGLDLEVAPRRLAAIVGGQADPGQARQEVASGPQRTAIAAAPQPAQAVRDVAPPAVAAAAAPGERDWYAAIDACQTVGDLTALGQEARAAGLSDPGVITAFQRRNAQLVDVPAQEAPAVPDAPPVEEPPQQGGPSDADAAWQQLVAAAGAAGMDQLDAVDQLLADLYPDVTPGQYTAQQMRDALGSLPTTQAGAA